MGEEREADPRLDAVPASRIVPLKRRPEFLAAAGGRRWIAPAFILQAAPRPIADDSARGDLGLGFTASRRVGNAVARNRAKRRLREAARLLLPDHAQPAYNYVVIARSAVLTCPFQALLDDLGKAFCRILTIKPRATAGKGGLRSAPRP